MRLSVILLLLCAFAGCKKCPEKVPPFTWQEIQGRDEPISAYESVRRPIYHVKVPKNWVRIDPDTTTLITDTKIPNVTFLVDEDVRLTVHTFPSNSLEERIPVTAQVERWKTQIEAKSSTIQEVTWAGFIGLALHAKNKQKSVLAWSLQLDFDHYQQLKALASNEEEENHFHQMCADVTIKVEGPTQKIAKLKPEIAFFAQSFELIEEIPERM